MLEMHGSLKRNEEINLFTIKKSVRKNGFDKEVYFNKMEICKTIIRTKEIFYCVLLTKRILNLYVTVNNCVHTHTHIYI